MDLKKEISFGRKNAGQKPGKTGSAKVLGKTSINLAAREKSSVNLAVAVPAIVIIIVLAALLSKFAVVDLLADLSEAQNRAAADQAQLDADNAEIESYGDLLEKYAHYTFSGMNNIELTSAARADILALLQDEVMPYVAVNSWGVSYNTVRLQVTGSSLQEINQVVQRLNDDDRVAYCIVNTAQTDDDDNNTAETFTDENGEPVTAVGDTVTAAVTVTMTDVEKGAFNG